MIKTRVYIVIGVSAFQCHPQGIRFDLDEAKQLGESIAKNIKLPSYVEIQVWDVDKLHHSYSYNKANGMWHLEKERE